MPNANLNLNDPEINSRLFTASGSWISATPLAQPLQTVSIECWKDFNYCWFITSTIDEKSGYISQFSNIEEIAVWTDDKIETVPSQTGFACVEYVTRINRKEKTITSTRTTLLTTGPCDGVDKEPIVLQLGDGYRRVENWKKQHGYLF